MNTCKTCKWWNGDGNETQKECHCPKITYGVSPESPDGACVIDYEYYNATFETGPDFGCIHHEEES